MLLNLRDIINIPDAKKDFHIELDLSGLDFYGEKPIAHPVAAEGQIVNHAGALVLSGTADSQLELVCDRCGKQVSRRKTVKLDCLLATELENQEQDDEIVLLDGNELDLDELVSTAYILALDTKNLCSDDCKGLCSKCGANLNLGPCQCKPEVDPRLAVLAQLLKDETE